MTNYDVKEVLFTGLSKQLEQVEFRTSAESVQIIMPTFKPKTGADGEFGRSQIGRTAISIMGIDKNWLTNIEWYPDHVSFIDEDMKLHSYGVDIEDNPKNLLGGFEYKLRLDQ